MPAKDPRTIARDIPGIFDVLFPQLLPSTVRHFNRQARTIIDQEPVSQELIKASHLQHSMLFEIAYARAEQILANTSQAEWQFCIKKAEERQRRHFDAVIPQVISDNDKLVAEQVANNLVVSLQSIAANSKADLQASPVIPGYHWIASGHGDFSIGKRLIEVKCTEKRFSSSDFRQIIMYWLLSYAASVENRVQEWESGILLNPRLNLMLELPFTEILSVVSAGRSKIELLEMFGAMIGDYSLRMNSERSSVFIAEP